MRWTGAWKLSRSRWIILFLDKWAKVYGFCINRSVCLYTPCPKTLMLMPKSNLKETVCMSVSTTLKKFGLEQAFNYLYKDPEKHMRTLLSWADKYAGKMYPHQLAQVREAVENPDHPFYGYIRHLINDVDRDVFKTIAVNFFINENMIGWPKQLELKEKYGCNIPWTILLDPTSACNLHCTGCWAAEYGNRLNLSYDEIDDIIRQAKNWASTCISTPAGNRWSAKPT